MGPMHIQRCHKKINVSKPKSAFLYLYVCSALFLSHNLYVSSVFPQYVFSSEKENLKRIAKSVLELPL